MGKYVCGVPGEGHEGDLHEWEIGKPGMGRIVLCAIHEEIYRTSKMKPRPVDCQCGPCEERKMERK